MDSTVRFLGLSFPMMPSAYYVLMAKSPRLVTPKCVVCSKLTPMAILKVCLSS